MSAFDVALRRIMTIPRDVLKQAFQPSRYDPTYNRNYYDNQLPVSIESIITDKVITGRVMLDIDLVSGTEIDIPLAGSEIQQIDSYNVLYRIPENNTKGRVITSALEVMYGHTSQHMGGPNTPYSGLPGRASTLMESSKALLRSSAGMTPSSTARVQLAGHNTILISDTALIGRFTFLRCQVTNDPNLSNLRTQYHQDFANLCLLATKSFIYSNLVIEIDEGQLRGGQQVGRFREIVDSFADAETLYIEELKRWQKIGILNDPRKARRAAIFALGSRPIH